MKKPILICLLALIGLSACKKANSNKTTSTLALSGKYALYMQVDTSYSTPKSFTVVPTPDLVADTLNFTSSIAGIETGTNWLAPNPFSYSLKTNYFNDGGPYQQPYPDIYYIYIINSTTIKILVTEGANGVVGDSAASYYKKL